jgi:uncharacterized protein (DUF433 family)
MQDERIVTDPTILLGKPTIRGTRLTVEILAELIDEGWSSEDIQRNYPQIGEEDLRAVFRWVGHSN